MNSLFNIGYSGIRAAQTQLNVTALNTANLATPGYTRQRVEQMAIGPMGQVRFDSGSGVAVTSIRRMADQFLTSQVWRANSEGNFYATAQNYLGQLETLVGSETSGLGEGLDNLFGALSGATERPENQAMRQNVLSNAKMLATRFNKLQEFINKQHSDIRTQQQNSIGSINVLSTNIADYNKKITESEARGGDTSILRDQRDELVKQLSGFIDVRINETPEGSYTVALSGGQPLVSGSTAGKLAFDESGANRSLSLSFSTTSFSVDMDCGGALGGLYQYETETLNCMEESVQGMAKSLADTFNSQLAAGFDMKGNPGKPLFSFDLANANGMLEITDITWDELAFSSISDANGNNDNLQELIKVGNLTMDIPGMGNTTLSNASATMVGTVATHSRDNQAALEAASTLLTQAENDRSNYSSVSEDEEAINLIVYTKAYQSNMKVISTGDQIFNDLLALF
ncbi:flagellar hook-associated protein FlgK [Pantoea agglomerans]|uniref:Flagellar hook-associated protein FlgK n=1 Tax=Enterobacter agglomerans TaxID=549 RepID=A0ACC5RIZ5_ENTAG|nr:flagellar hook-associated protein FlgK [Pantoea agglomerans]MBK4724677.1 flagellar hook-associated protein FlgK [Pantoea agglomerans]